MLRSFFKISSLFFIVFFCFKYEKSYAGPPQNERTLFYENLTGKYSFSSDEEEYTAWFVRDMVRGRGFSSLVIENSLVNRVLSKIQGIAENPAQHMRVLCDSTNVSVDRARNMHSIWGVKGVDVLPFPQRSVRNNMSTLRLDQSYRLSYMEFEGKEYALSELKFHSDGRVKQLKFSPTGFFPRRGKTVTVDKVSEEELPYLMSYVENYFKLQEHIFPNPDGCSRISAIFP